MGLAADAIRVLYACVALKVAVADGTAIQQFCHCSGHVDLALVAAQAVDRGVERRGRSHNGICRHGRRDDSRYCRAPTLEQSSKGASRRKLRSVDQCEAFFRAQNNRRQPSLFQCLTAWHFPPIIKRFALSDHHGGHMRQRGQIARRAHRTLHGDHGQNTTRQHGFDLRANLPAHARCATPEREQLERHHQAGGCGLQHIANPAAMGQDQVTLERFGVIGGNTDRGEFAKTCVDAVDRRVALCCGCDDVGGCLNSVAGSAIKCDRARGAPKGLQGGQGRGTGVKDLGHAEPPKMRACKGLIPMP